MSSEAEQPASSGQTCSVSNFTDSCATQSLASALIDQVPASCFADSPVRSDPSLSQPAAHAKVHANEKHTTASLQNPSKRAEADAGMGACGSPASIHPTQHVAVSPPVLSDSNSAHETVAAACICKPAYQNQSTAVPQPRKLRWANAAAWQHLNSYTASQCQPVPGGFVDKPALQASNAHTSQAAASELSSGPKQASEDSAGRNPSSTLGAVPGKGQCHGDGGASIPVRMRAAMRFAEATVASDKRSAAAQMQAQAQQQLTQRAAAAMNYDRAPSGDEMAAQPDSVPAGSGVPHEPKCAAQRHASHTTAAHDSSIAAAGMPHAITCCPVSPETDVPGAAGTATTAANCEGNMFAACQQHSLQSADAASQPALPNQDTQALTDGCHMHSLPSSPGCAPQHDDAHDGLAQSAEAGGHSAHAASRQAGSRLLACNIVVPDTESHAAQADAEAAAMTEQAAQALSKVQGIAAALQSGDAVVSQQLMLVLSQLQQQLSKCVNFSSIPANLSQPSDRTIAALLHDLPQTSWAVAAAVSAQAQRQGLTGEASKAQHMRDAALMPPPQRRKSAMRTCALPQAGATHQTHAVREQQQHSPDACQHSAESAGATLTAASPAQRTQPARLSHAGCAAAQPLAIAQTGEHNRCKAGSAVPATAISTDAAAMDTDEVDHVGAVLPAASADVDNAMTCAQPSQPAASTLPQHEQAGPPAATSADAAGTAAGPAADTAESDAAAQAQAGPAVYCDSLAVRRPRRRAAQHFSADSASKRRAKSAPAADAGGSQSGQAGKPVSGASSKSRTSAPEHQQAAASKLARAADGVAAASDGLDALRALGGTATLFEDSDSPCMQSSDLLQGMQTRRRAHSAQASALSASDAASFAEALGKCSSKSVASRQPTSSTKRARSCQHDGQLHVAPRKSSKSRAPSASARSAPSGSPALSTSPGMSKLPKGLEVHGLGRIEYLNPTFHNDLAVFPVGFRVCPHSSAFGALLLYALSVLLHRQREVRRHALAVNAPWHRLPVHVCALARLCQALHRSTICVDILSCR